MNELSRIDLAVYYRYIFKCLVCGLDYGSDSWDSEKERYCPSCMNYNRRTAQSNESVQVKRKFINKRSK